MVGEDEDEEDEEDDQQGDGWIEAECWGKEGSQGAVL